MVFGVMKAKQTAAAAVVVVDTVVMIPELAYLVVFDDFGWHLYLNQYLYEDRT